MLCKLDSLLVERVQDYVLYRSTTLLSSNFLTPLASPQPDRLAVLLELGDQGIALLDKVRVLLVLIVRAVRLDNSVDPVNCARYPVGGYELGQVPVVIMSVACNFIAERYHESTYLSRKSTVTPKSLAMLLSPTTR